jgi:hypothetical protein
VADAAYGSEQNYVYVEEKKIGNYLKYNTFYQDVHSNENTLANNQLQRPNAYLDVQMLFG